MVIDDSFFNRLLVGKFITGKTLRDTTNTETVVLEGEGCHCLLVASGQAAIRYLESDPNACELFIVDFQMPQMNGWQTIDAIHRIAERHHKQYQIYMLTAASTEEAKRGKDLLLNETASDSEDSEHLIQKIEIHNKPVKKDCIQRMLLCDPLESECCSQSRDHDMSNAQFNPSLATA